MKSIDTPSDLLSVCFVARFASRVCVCDRSERKSKKDLRCLMLYNCAEAPRPQIDSDGRRLDGRCALELVHPL